MTPQDKCTSITLQFTAAFIFSSLGKIAEYIRRAFNRRKERLVLPPSFQTMMRKRRKISLLQRKHVPWDITSCVFAGIGYQGWEKMHRGKGTDCICQRKRSNCFGSGCGPLVFEIEYINPVVVFWNLRTHFWCHRPKPAPTLGWPRRAFAFANPLSLSSHTWSDRNWKQGTSVS